VAAHIAHFHTKWGFSIKKLMCNPFVEGHQSLQGVEKYWHRVKFLPWEEFEWQRHQKGNE